MFSTGFLRKLPTNTYKHLLLVGSGKIKMANSHVGSNANFSEIRKPSNKFMPVTHVIFDLDGLILGKR